MGCKGCAILISRAPLATINLQKLMWRKDCFFFSFSGCLDSFSKVPPASPYLISDAFPLFGKWKWPKKVGDEGAQQPCKSSILGI